MAKKQLRSVLFYNFMGGIATGLGVTVGIAIVAYLLSLIMNLVGGLPLIGNFLAKIIQATLFALNKKVN